MDDNVEETRLGGRSCVDRRIEGRAVGKEGKGIDWLYIR